MIRLPARNDAAQVMSSVAFLYSRYIHGLLKLGSAASICKEAAVTIGVPHTWIWTPASYT